MRRRRICWPAPDAVCLQGGCIWCEDYRPRSYAVIEAYAKKHGLEKDFIYGRDWHPVRDVA